MDNFEAAWLAPVHQGVRLHFFSGSRDGGYVEIQHAGSYSFGRDPSSAFGFSVRDPVDAKVSRGHALMRVDHDGVTLESLNPTNGMAVFDVDIEPGSVIRLQDGDLIRLGRGGPRVGVRIGALSSL